MDVFNVVFASFRPLDTWLGRLVSGRIELNIEFLIYIWRLLMGDEVGSVVFAIRDQH